MIKDFITDEIFNNLQWDEVPPPSLEAYIKGYYIEKIESCIAWQEENGTEAIDGIVLYLRAPGVLEITVLMIVTDTYLGEKEKSPLRILRAVIKLENENKLRDKQ